MSADSRRLLRVGLFVLGALALFAAVLVVLGEKQFFFTPKARYVTHFRTVGGLRPTASVKLDGVEVGHVENILLPTDTGERLIEVRLAIDRRYRQRVRLDSIVRIKTLGLLGDKYLEITSGSPGFPETPMRGELRAAAPTNVAELVASGEDVVENIVAVSRSLDSILQRIERGEGTIGQLFRPVPDGTDLSAEAVATLRALRLAAERVANGRGPLYRLAQDEALGDRMASAVERLDRVLAQAESGPGLLPALLTDGATRERFTITLDRLADTAARLEEAAGGLAGGDSLLATMLHDEDWGREVAGELRDLVRTLRQVAEKLDRGDGTAARLLNDPAAHEALDDILVGIDESRLLRWLVRNRQRAGIEKRYREERGAPGGAPPPATGPTGDELR